MDMRWLRWVGSLKLEVSFAKEPYKRDHMLQKRPIILKSLLIIATPPHIYIYTKTLWKQPKYGEQLYIRMCVHVYTGWRRLIGCLKSPVILRKRATNWRALLRKMTYEDKAFYDSTPPCTGPVNEHRRREVGGWGRDPKKCTGSIWGMGSSTI